MSGSAGRPGVRTSVLVLAFDGREHLDACLGSLGALDVFRPGEPGVPRDPDLADEVCLVDNGSTDGSLARVKERFPWVRVLPNAENLGFAGGYDAAIPRVESEWVALLNSDARVDPGWLGELHRTAAAHAACRAVAGRILSWDGARIDFQGADTFFTGHAWQRGLGDPAGDGGGPERQLLFGCGASLLLHRETFLRHGGFDPDYFAFFEDVDLGWRMALAGDETWLAPRAVAYHKLHGSFGSRPQARVRFLAERNALASVSKNFSDGRGGVLLLASAALAFLRGWISSAASSPDARPFLTTDGLAHLLALADLARLEPSLARRRVAVQAARRRTDAELQPLFGDLSRPPTALGEEYRGPLEAVVARLGLERDGFARAFSPELDSAARAAATDLARLCARALSGRYEPAALFARGGDLDWEHPLDDGAARLLRAAAAGARDLLRSDFGPAALEGFVRGLGGAGAPPARRPAAASGAIGTEPSGTVTVTVVVRTKDRPVELRAALESLRAQTFRDFEVLLVDDGETDAAPELAAPGEALPAVRLLRTGGLGRAAAAQAGLTAARGEFVCYLDDDDLLLPDHLERLVGTQRATGARVVHSVAMRVAPVPDGAFGTRLEERGALGGPLDPSLLPFESTLPLMTVLMDRELALEAGGFDGSLDYFEDWDLFLRLSRRATFAHCPHVTALYRLDPGRGHGSGVTGEHRWPFLAGLFERHRGRVTGVAWARFYRERVEGARLRAEARSREAEDRARGLEERARAAEEERDRVVAVLRSVERSLGYRAVRVVRRLLGRD